MILISHFLFMARMSLVGPFSDNYADQHSIQQYLNYRPLGGGDREWGYKEETKSIIQR